MTEIFKRPRMKIAMSNLLLLFILGTFCLPLAVRSGDLPDFSKRQDDFMKSTMLHLDATQRLFLEMEKWDKGELRALQASSRDLIAEFVEEGRKLDKLSDVLVLALRHTEHGYAMDRPDLLAAMNADLPAITGTDQELEYSKFQMAIEVMKDKVFRFKHLIALFAERLELKDRLNGTQTADSAVPQEIRRRFEEHLVAVSRISLDLLGRMREPEVVELERSSSKASKENAELGICAELSIHLGTMQSNVLVDVVSFVAPHDWSRIHDTVQLLSDGSCFSSRRVESRGGGRVRVGKHDEDDVRQILAGVVGLAGEESPLLSVDSRDSCTIVRWRRDDGIQRAVLMGPLEGRSRETLRLLVSALPFSDRYDIDRLLGRGPEGDTQTVAGELSGQLRETGDSSK